VAAIGLIESALRHGQQTLLLGRLRQRHLVPMAERLDGCGFAALDVFGGSPYEVALAHLAEDPFARLREVREVTATPLLCLLRGQALVGYRQLPDDVVDSFIAETASAGIDRFRCFDPLNDLRNLARPIAAVLEAGRHPEGTLVYTESPVHDLAGFIEIGRGLATLGARSLCILDAAGLLGAGNARALVAGLHQATGLPVTLHCAAVTGQAVFAYLAGAEGGAAALDVALSPLAGGASLPATEGVVAGLRGTPIAPDVDERRIAACADALDELMPLYRAAADPAGWQVDARTLVTQLAPSVQAHLRWECETQGVSDRLPAVLLEIPRIRAELGFPPLITPIAQVVVTQAVYNVASGERYLTVAQEVKDYLLGLYGRPPGPVDPEVQRLVCGGEEPLTVRPADVLDPMLERARRAMEREGLPVSDPTAVLHFVLFPDAAAALLRGEARAERLGDEAEAPTAAETGPPPARDDGGQGAAAAGEREPRGDREPARAPGATAEPSEAGGRVYDVEVGGERFRVLVRGGAGPQGGAAGPGPTRREGGGGAGDGDPEPVAHPGARAVVAPMQGLVLTVAVAVGDLVRSGQTVAVLEAMKMQNDITAATAGTVVAVHVTAGAIVSRDQKLVSIG